MIIGTVDGTVKRIGLTNFKEIDWIKEKESRISHVSYIEDNDDSVLAISSDGVYSIIKLDGDQKFRENTVSSTVLFTIDEVEVLKRRFRKRLIIFIIVFLVLIFVILGVYFEFH